MSRGKNTGSALLYPELRSKTYEKGWTLSDCEDGMLPPKGMRQMFRNCADIRNKPASDGGPVAVDITPAADVFVAAEARAFCSSCVMHMLSLHRNRTSLHIVLSTA